MNKNIPALLLALSVAIATSMPAHADEPALQEVGIRGDFSGTWFDPAQPGHGLTIEINDGARATVAWFTFDGDGAPMWLFGVGRVDGAVLHVPVSRVEGGAFPPLFDPDAVDVAPWGELTLRFSGCNAGELEWVSGIAGFEPGSMPLQRSTSVQGTRCNVEEEFAEQRIFSFERGPAGFEAVFADYPPGQEAFYELDFAHETLPAPLDARGGLRLSGNNHSDDLAMLVKAPVRGLYPNILYRIEVEAEVASNVPSGCMGTGGSPGESVWIKLGASTQEPLAITDNSDGSPIKRLNIDYGQQSQSGDDARVVGTMGNGDSCDDFSFPTWKLRTLSTQGEPFFARADADGVLWLVAGTDSGFESRTDVYLTALRLRMDVYELGIGD